VDNDPYCAVRATAFPPVDWVVDSTPTQPVDALLELIAATDDEEHFGDTATSANLLRPVLNTPMTVMLWDTDSPVIVAVFKTEAASVNPYKLAMEGVAV